MHCIRCLHSWASARYQHSVFEGCLVLCLILQNSIRLTPSKALYLYPTMPQQRQSEFLHAIALSDEMGIYHWALSTFPIHACIHKPDSWREASFAHCPLLSARILNFENYTSFQVLLITVQARISAKRRWTGRRIIRSIIPCRHTRGKEYLSFDAREWDLCNAHDVNYVSFNKLQLWKKLLFLCPLNSQSDVPWTSSKPWTDHNIIGEHVPLARCWILCR